MPDRLPIDIQPGLISDVTPFSTAGTFAAANQMRFYRGKATACNGRQRISDQYLTGVCRDVLPFKDNTGSEYIIFGTHAGLQLWNNSGDIIDVTPTDFTPGNIDSLGIPGYGIGLYGSAGYGEYIDPTGNLQALTWSLQSWGQDVIAAPCGGAIYWWQNTGGATINRAARLDSMGGSNHVPAHTRFVLAHPQLRQLIAFGCEQEYQADGITGPGPYSPNLIRCSDTDGNLLDWAVLTTNNADEMVSPLTGTLMGAVVVGTQIALWSDTGLAFGTWVGSQTQSWEWTPIDGALGLIGPNAMTSIGQTVYWVSPDKQLWSYTVTAAPTQIPCPIRDDTLANIAQVQGAKVTMTWVPQFNELRIDYPDERSVTGGNLENSRYLTMELDTGSFSQGAVSRTAYTRGSPFVYPISVQTQTLALPFQQPITTNSAAQQALAAINAGNAAFSGANLVLQANCTATTGAGYVAPLITNTVVTGNAQWGIRYTSNGSNTATYRANVAGLGLTVGDRASISFKGQTTIGGNVPLKVQLTGSTDDLLANVVTTYAQQTYKFENITVTQNTDVLAFTINGSDFGASGNTVELTDIMVQRNAKATNWLPPANDSSLASRYGPFLATITYPQLVGTPFYEEFGTLDENGDDIIWSITTNAFALDDDASTFMVTRFIPDFRGQTDQVALYIRSSQFPNDPDEILFGPYMIMPTDRKVDFRITGKIFKFQLSGSGPFALGRPLVDVVKGGFR